MNALDELLNAGARRASASSPASGEPVPDLLAEFHNPKRPQVEYQHEKPEHRIVLFLKAQGLSNREIAEKTGYTPCGVSLIVNQPWAQEKLLQVLNEAGVDRVQALLAGAAEDSVFTLIELRDDAEQPGTVRKAAASDLLDRFLGKPRQQVDVVQHKPVTTESVAEIDKELAGLREQEKQLLGNN